MDRFSSAELLFFRGREEALPLYGAVLERIYEACPEVRIEVKKTQISFFARYMFAAASFTPVGPAQDRPRPFLTVSLCLPERLQGSRVAAAAEPYPGRWTVHILLGKPEDADGELTCWLRMAAVFAAQRGKRA